MPAALLPFQTTKAVLDLHPRDVTQAITSLLIHIILPAGNWRWDYLPVQIPKETLIDHMQCILASSARDLSEGSHGERQSISEATDFQRLIITSPGRLYQSFSCDTLAQSLARLSEKLNGTAQRVRRRCNASLFERYAVGFRDTTAVLNKVKVRYAFRMRCATAKSGIIKSATKVTTAATPVTEQTLHYMRPWNLSGSHFT